MIFGGVEIIMEYAEFINDNPPKSNFKRELFKVQKSDCRGNGKGNFPQMSSPFSTRSAAELQLQLRVRIFWRREHGNKSLALGGVATSTLYSAVGGRFS